MAESDTPTVGGDSPPRIDITGRVPAVATTRSSEPASGYRGAVGTGRVARRTATNLNLAEIDLAMANPFDLLDAIIDVSPDAGMALNNQLRLGNPGWTITCQSVRGNNDPVATRLANDMMSLVNRGIDAMIPGAMGGPDSFINTQLLYGFTRGAMSAETILTSDFKNFYDLVPIEPQTVEFFEDTSNPGRYTIKQRQRGKNEPVELNPNLVTYIPVDDDLYGRAPIAPALQIIPFWIDFYANLQVFLRNAAWGFIDGEVDIDKLMEAWPDVDDKTRERFNERFIDWAMEQARLLSEDYAAARKKDADALIAHLSLLKLTVKDRGNQMFPVKDVTELLKREIFNALKQLPIFMGSNEGTTESFANVQLAIFNNGVRRYQKMVKHIIERAILTGLLAMGYPKRVVVKFEFEGIQAEDRLKLARAMEIENRVYAFQREQGWIEQDESATRATGSAAVGPPTAVGLAMLAQVRTESQSDRERDNGDEDGETTNAEYDDTRNEDGA